MANRSIREIPLLQLAIWSLVVGMVLYLFDSTPQELITWVIETSQSLFEWFTQNVFTYVLMGAIIVIPVWGISRLWAYVRNKP